MVIKMDEIKRYALAQQAKLVHVDLYMIGQAGEEVCLWGHMDNNPLSENDTLKKQLVEAAVRQQEPFIYCDRNQVLFACICNNDRNRFLLLGPMALKKMDVVELHQYYETYSMKAVGEQKLVVHTLSRVLAIVGLINAVFAGAVVSEEDLIQANHLDFGTDRHIEKEFLEFDFQREEELRYHHSYAQEKKLLDCVREGRAEDALQMNMDLDIETGRLSRNDMHHWQHLVVVAITLCTRAAIEGGLPPAEAYRISDYYIQKSESCKEISDLVTWRNRAVKELAQRVCHINSTVQVSNYVEKAKNYIAAHYREKVYLDEIAEKLSISPTYLSKLFVKETRERLQDYIVRFRVERAANLLMYSEESISDIAEYVNFPSQSYLGKVFKKYKKMTPQKYRDKYKPREFES